MSRAALLRSTVFCSLAICATAPQALANGFELKDLRLNSSYYVTIENDDNLEDYLNPSGIYDADSLPSTQSLSIGYESGPATLNVLGNGTITTSNLYMGYLAAASGNKLNIQTGGKVTASDSYIGYATGSTGNIATVTGANSEWNAGANLHVGYEGASNELKILDGGKVISSTSWVGNEATAGQNIVTVRGEGSSWTTSGNFNLGKSGSANQLNVSDGAGVSANLLTIGRTGSNNILALSGGGTVAAAAVVVGDTNLSTGNEVKVTGAGSQLSVTGSGGALVIGKSGSRNTLVVEDGGRIEVAQTLAIGDQNGSNENTATFRGAASGPFVQAAINFVLDVGTRGQFNRVDVIEGANVWTGSEITIGRFGSDNSMLVDGQFGFGRPSTIDTDIIYVGLQGGTNTLTLSNSAVASSRLGFIGRDGSANGNSVTVSGGAVWNIDSEDFEGSLFVGHEGSLNRLELSEGGQVNSSGRLVIGGHNDLDPSGGGSASDNTVVVAGLDGEGPQTRLLSRGLTVGLQGSGNTVIVQTGGILETQGNTLIGNSLNAGNSVQVFGPGSRWTVTGDLGINEFRTPPIDSGVISALSTRSANSLSIGDGGNVEVAYDLVVFGNGVIDLGAGATLTAGTLTLSDDSLLSIYLDDDRNSNIDIAGTAALDGDLDVKLGKEDLQDNRYTVLTAGDVTGTFDSFGLRPVYNDLFALASLNARIEYTGTSVDILFDSDIGGDEDLNVNQTNVSDAINAYYNAGGEIPVNFVPLLGLTGDDLLTTLDGISGEVGATGGANQVWQGQNAFLSLMLKQDASAAQAGDALASSSTSIYGMTVTPTADAPPSSGWTMWGSAFAASSSLPGDAGLGSTDTDTNLIGLATGWDRAISSDATMGFAIAGGGTRWDLADGLGNGNSTFLQFGAHGSKRFGSSYLSLAGAYAWHWMETERSALGDTLEAEFAASSLAGRLEGGHRFGEKGDLGLTPYAALTAQASFLPDYEESGGSAALAFEEKTATALRSELGLRLDHTADTVRLDASLAWAHDWRSEDSVDASFLSLPGASFTVFGADSPDDLALVSAGAAFTLGPRTSLTARLDGEFGEDYATYGGTLALTYNW